MTRYTVLTTFQLFLLTLLVGVVAGGLSTASMMYRDYKLLPEVAFNPAGQCIKVINYENGHAFSCQDVDVLLRRYRKLVIVQPAP